MENVSMITDFTAEDGRYRQVPTPGLTDYQVYYGSNFIFISNSAGKTIRFSQWENTNITEETTVKNWITQIRKKFPKF